MASGDAGSGGWRSVGINVADYGDEGTDNVSNLGFELEYR